MTLISAAFQTLPNSPYSEGLLRPVFDKVKCFFRRFSLGEGCDDQTGCCCIRVENIV